ncbi:hypothetical protein GHK92_16640 [Nocardioides sp. dk4132]|uniref:hypothetical protein n=1 Tax=unclassified Nocardioides TaxID=2615069 RepID=UPI00129499A8|nr:MULTISPECIES: hypothetical protein [unclassified Nocardioides]MQW77502.1 hypothetical protein [Nocardioides sp. dk4132]QGA09300.1 hypothetical protein GFH29_19320 [Nocardioides sp. dk884]
MRFQRTLALGVAFLAFLLLGPVVLLVVLGLLAVPRVRAWLRPTWRVVAGWVGAVVVVTGLVVVIPDGWLPVPPGPGLAVTPSYVGRPARVQPIEMAVPQHPALAPNGRSSMHNDAWSSDAYPGPGPVGDSVEVDTAWFGLEECATLAFDRHDRLVALCGDLSGPTLRVLDPDSMRPLATKSLPERADSDVRPWEDLCGGSYFYLDSSDRAVLATTDRRVLVVSTSDAEGEPDLTTEATHDLSAVVPGSDCLVALMPDWSGRIWWVSREGRVGTIARDGRIAALELGEEVANSMSVDATGVYLVTTEALHKLAADRRDRPVVRWRTAYERGSERKPGQLTQGSGTTPTILPGGIVAITDNAEPRMNVVFVRADDGAEVCRAAVFDEGSGATENSLVAVGDGVVVENNHGYAAPWRTLIGRSTTGGFARVDHGDGECRLVWTSEEVAPSSVAKASLATGLVYAWTKPRSWWGVNAWYFTALDARTGRTVFSVRAGLGTLMNNHYAAITLGPDGSAYIATLGGMVRVRDKG